MNDLELLRQYAQQGSEAAFATLVERHLNLVYATALRQVRSPQLAQETAQSVFLSLARNAKLLKPDTILTAWLYRVTRHAAIDLMRGESRRQIREQTAFELANMKSDSSEWAHIEPLLDEALEALDEPDRAAILLRYFENKSLREVGENLGTSEEAARKRVSRAVEQLRSGFSRRGIPIGAASLAVVLSAQSASVVPAGLCASINAAVALAGGAVQGTTTIGATKAIAMTLFQKTMITATIAVVVGAGIYDARRTVHLREQIDALQQKQDSLAAQNQLLQLERDTATNRLTSLQQDTARTHDDSSELLKLRGEVSRLRGESRELAQIKANANTAAAPTEMDPTESEMKSWLDRTRKLRQRMDKMPNQKIPEFQLLTDQDWLDSVRRLKHLETDADYNQAISSLKSAARNEFASTIQGAFRQFAQANKDQSPTDFTQLKPYLPSTMDDSVLQRYEFTQPGTISDKAGFQVDENGNLESMHMTVSLGSTSMYSSAEDSLKQAVLAYSSANSGQNPTDPAQLLPYVQTSDEKAALQKLMQNGPGK